MHLTRILSVGILAGSLLSCAAPQPGVSLTGDASLSFPNEARLSNIRQLTFGGTNAEAYWSYDGKFLTYQHSGEDAKCDQIYRIGLDRKTKNRVSNGMGRTTCSFFAPGDDHIVFSSTHSAGKDCPVEPDKSKGYLWPIYPTYQFYRARADGKDVIPIEPGAPSSYNAELVTCKDGKVVFTSDRGGDLDLYVGRLDGRGMIIDVKQVTKTLGYDGGAFFSPDCTKLVWRASRPKPGKEAEDYVDHLRRHLVKPAVLEIYVANADGSDAKQITKLGGSTFAPYFTPDGGHVLFASNYKTPGSRNFDLYMVRTNGTELEQVTHSGTFDSFPMFSPDGKYLAFSSNRNARKARETNIFVADWNARVPGPIITEEDTNAVNRWHVMAKELSASDMEGRGVGTEGLGRAEAYVAEMYEKAGVREMGPLYGFGEDIKGFEHEVEFLRGVELDAKKTSLKADWRQLKTREEFAPAAFSKQGGIAGKIIDIGYGVVATELGVDDYEGKSVKGRIVLVRKGVAAGLGLSPSQSTTYGDLRYKAFLARERGAAGIAFWDPEAGDEKKPEDLMVSINTSNSVVAADAGIPAIFVSRKIAREWLGAGKPVSLAGKIALDHKKITTSNVVGIMGSDEACRSGRPIVIGAHLDHLGYGGEGSLEAGFTKRVHHGADDNASGVATMIEVARNIGAALKEKKASGCYIFAAFTAEESGVLGSSRFVDLLRKKNIRPKAMLNMDMVGRLSNNSLSVFGAATASEWKKIVKKNCDRFALSCAADGDGYGPSDQMPFYIARVPVLHFFTGAHGDYHRASDTSDKLNPVGGVQIAELVSTIATEAADRKTALTYVKLTGKNTMAAIQSRGGGKGFGAYLGTIPNYTQMNSGEMPQVKAMGGARPVETPKGILLSGAREGSPAAEGGVREGDIITAITLLDDSPGFAAVQPKTRQTESLEDFTFVLKDLQPGMRIKLHVWRKGDKLELPVKVGRRATK